MTKPLLFSFFSGSGFLDLGFENTGFEIAFVNEFHKPFLEAYKYTRQQMKHASPSFGYSNDSIEEFLSGAQKECFSQIVADAKTSKRLVGFIGGPPCPDFSVGGKNKGRDGDNGKLTQTYIDLILKDLPDFFIFENVKGLWRTKQHREFYEEVKLLLQSTGYQITDRLTNCLEYGAPQDRDRILMFGIKSSLIDCKLEDAFDWESRLIFDSKKLRDKKLWPTTDDFVENSNTISPLFANDEMSKLTVKYWFERNDVENHPNAKHFFKPKSDKFKVIKEGDNSKKSFKRLHRWRYSPTAAYGNNEVHLHPYKARRLSAAEALAIQTLPPEFHFPVNMTLSNMFKTIGNGVPYVAAKGLAETVMQFLECNLKLS